MGLVSSLRDTADSLAIQLDHQGVSGASPLTVAAFTYGITDLSSSFGRRVGLDLAGALVRRARAMRAQVGSSSAPHLAVRGIYIEQRDEIRLSATAKESESGKLVGHAETSVPRRALPAGLSLRPANFQTALKDQKLLADGELTAALTVKTHRVSDAARAKIEAAGGTVEELTPRRSPEERRRRRKIKKPKAQAPSAKTETTEDEPTDESDDDEEQDDSGSETESRAAE